MYKYTRSHFNQSSRFSLYTISYDGGFFLFFLTITYKADRHKPRTTPDEKIMTGRIHFLWLGAEVPESKKKLKISNHHILKSGECFLVLRNCWLACVLLCWYCFVECFLVLQKLLLVGLCGCCSVSLIFCIKLFDDYSKCGNY